ncbi:MAG: DNA-protecting protein DprA [Clostridiaceae bacterium]|nr:DNA-protecting protein DprA [Clostridiaceae bacterium]
MQAGGLKGILPYLKEPRESQGFHESFLAQAMESELINLKGKTFPDSWRAVTFLDPLYPRRLLQISRPPALLFMSGQHLSALNQNFVVGIIGSRKPSSYGVEVTRKLAGEIADRGVAIVSGGARGIDGLAHARALERGGLTLAVTGSGLGRAYPPEHRTLFNNIEKRGGLITEFVPGTMPRRNHFPARNRILAGLCDAILITEASHASGTLITAGFAADYGREVMAVPGSILSGSSRSCHALIRDGASLIESVDDIPGMPAPYRMDQPQDQAKEPGACHLDAEDEAILQALDHAPRTLEGLVQSSGYSRESLALRLAILQNRGLVSLHRGLYCRAIRDPA